MPEANASGIIVCSKNASAWDNLGVRVSIEIPKKFHPRLRQKGKAEGCTVNELIVKALEKFLVPDTPKPRRVKLPIIPSKRPGTLHLDNVKIFEIIDFP